MAKKRRPGRPRKYSEHQRKQAWQMRHAGLRWRQIGAALGCHRGTALKLAREYTERLQHGDTTQ